MDALQPFPSAASKEVNANTGATIPDAVVYYDANHGKHAGADSSAECPERLDAILSVLQKLPVQIERDAEPLFFHPQPLSKRNCCVCTYPLLTPGATCSMCESQSSHEWCYVEQIKGDTTYMTPFTAEIVARAQSMIETAAARNHPFTFCLTRPPGHHACEGRIAGFCHENFVIHALDIFWFRYRKNCVILDIDAHYGDGTVTEIEKRPFGSFVSLHGFGASVYPGTGASLKSDRILSLPLHPKTTDAEYLHTLESEAIPFLVAKKPDILLVSAGFDGHVADTMAPLALTTQAYSEIGKRLASLQIPVFAVLEGGYNLSILGESVAAFVSAFTTCG